MPDQPDGVTSPAELPDSQPAQSRARFRDWELVPLSGIIPWLVFAYSKSHLPFSSWILVTGFVHGFFILNGNFRYGAAQKAVATLIMLGIGTYWHAGSTKIFALNIDSDNERASTANLKQIGLATLQYLQDYDEKHPPRDTMEHFKTVIGPYVKQNTVFIEPGANVPYALNGAMSHKSLDSIVNPAATVILQETVPHNDGKIYQAYADGHVHFKPQQAAK